MSKSLLVAFESSPKNAADLARRYRVLAAMSAEGVTFTMRREDLLAMAQVFDTIGRRPDVLVVEREAALSGPLGLWMAFLLTLSMAGLAGDAALALLRWIGWVA